jgi:hypothetical protein
MRFVTEKCLFGLAVAGLLAVAAAAGGQVWGSQSIEGKLAFEKGTGPVLETQGKNITLSARNSYMFNTLGDPRLRNKDVRLEGDKLPDGSFQVARILTVHNGKLYRIQYYCETCNIVALQPGPCMCCQHPVELQEIPLDKNDKNVIITK